MDSHAGIPARFTTQVVEDNFTSMTSMSDMYDHEPGLEFDDSELTTSSMVNQILTMEDEVLDLTPVNEMIAVESQAASDGTIDDNYEEELTMVTNSYVEIAHLALPYENFNDLNSTGLVEVVGDDEIGRRIIVISACRLPNLTELPPDRLLRFLMYRLDEYVEQDYTLIYFHYGLNKSNRPPTSWFWTAYKAFGRKYKKNIKALYLVHPTSIIKVVYAMLRPVLSLNFGKKLRTFNYLHELSELVDLKSIPVPQQVADYNNSLLARDSKAADLAIRTETLAGRYVPEQSTNILPTAQFGVSLQFILEHNPNVVDDIPPIVRDCVEYLLQPEELETVGIFRRSVNVTLIKVLKEQCNRGEAISLSSDENGVHCAAVLLKSFLKDLKEPIMTYDLFYEISQFLTWPNNEKPRRVKIIINEKLPVPNYRILKYIFKFLTKVSHRCCMNKMTVSNLAIVFGPNLIWPMNGQMPPHWIVPINAFAEFMLSNEDSIFVV